MSAHDPENISERVCTVIAGIIGAVPEKDDQIDTVLGMDSLDKVCLVIAIEDEFGLSLPDGVEMGWKTVGDVVATIRGPQL